MQDVFFFDVNSQLHAKGIRHFDDMLRSAAMSGLLSDMMTASMARHAHALVENRNGHPDLIVDGVYADNSVKAGEQGVEVKSTRKTGGAVDAHGARAQFVYRVDNETDPAMDRAPVKLTEIYLGRVGGEDFRRNQRGELGTRTATLHREGIRKLRDSWVCI